MELRFRNTDLLRCYEEESRASRSWGPTVGLKYIQRVTVLRAVERFTDLFQIRSLQLHALKGNRKGQHAIIIHGRWRLIVTYDKDEKLLFVEEVSSHYGD